MGLCKSAGGVLTHKQKSPLNSNLVFYANFFLWLSWPQANCGAVRTTLTCDRHYYYRIISKHCSEFTLRQTLAAIQFLHRMYACNVYIMEAYKSDDENMKSSTLKIKWFQ